MNRFILTLLVVPGTILAQASRDSTISASASKSSRHFPDRASMYLIVEGTAETTSAALARVEAKLRAVTDALRALGSRAETDRPVGFTLVPADRDGARPGTAPVPSYISRSVVRVQTNTPDQIATIVRAAIGAGASTMTSLTFESSVIDSVRRVRINEAVAAARQDAEAIATALGGRLGALLDVSSTHDFATQGPEQLHFDERSGMPQAPAPEIKVTANVTVRFRLIR
jgi:uncharacterized protein YggE